VPQKGYTLAQLEEAYALVQEYGTVAKAARAVGELDTNLRRRYDRYLRMAERGELGTKPTIPGFRISQATAVTNQDGELVREFIQQKPERGGEYKPTDGLGLAGKTTWVDVVGDERIVTREVLMERRIGETALQDIVEAVRGAFEEYKGLAPPAAEPVIVDPEIATVFPISDAHFGLYAWDKEAGENYDLAIADRTNREAFARLMAQTAPSEEAVLVGLGDLLHADNSENRTPQSGNVLDVDTRFAKVLQVAILYIIFAVDLARQRHRHVTLRVLPGNHDRHAAIAVTMALWAWFHDDSRVTVDVDPSYFWWWRWGTVLLGATHGDTVKMDKMPLVMAASRPEDWGQAKHRLILTGHVHNKSALEEGGVVVESFQSTAARDAWHQSAGYRSGRSMSAITFHNERGEISRQRVNIL
jgi:hypothetical protein